MALACTGALALVGCGRADGGALPIALVGEGSAVQLSSARSIAGLPMLSPAGQVLRGATTEGLVGFDAEGRVVAALADRWVVADDGESYIFRLRDGNWPDGKPITAEAAAGLLRRALAGLRGSALGNDLAALTDVRVMAGRVIEVDLAAPMPDLLALLAQPELGLAYAGRGSGPMTAKGNARKVSLDLLPPDRRGLPADPDFAGRSRTLSITLADAKQSVARFNDGYVDAVFGGTVDSLPLAGSGGLTRGNVQLDPVMGLYGLRIETDEGFLGDPSNREALAMAIDRDTFIGTFNIGGWAATSRLVSPQVPGDLGTIGERWQGLDLSQRRAAAAARVTIWKNAGHALPVLRVSTPGGAGSQRVLDRLRADWGAIGIGIHPVGPNAPAEIRLVDRVATYASASWFLNQLGCEVVKVVCSPAGDARVAEARKTRDPQQRAALLAEAEAEITAINNFIPIARPLRWSLVRNSVTGFAPNPLGWHPLPPLATLPK
jgi:peptide/nickel transport system substrate-binding protein/oligopeptide transport system substrate-binding protein